VLSHPLIVEAIEDEFVPIVVYNNQASGRDAKLLNRFKGTCLELSSRSIRELGW